MRREIYKGFAWIGAYIVWCWLFSGCSAFDPPMKLARSHYDETDRETGHIKYEIEPREMRCVGGRVEVRAFHSSIWRPVPVDRDWDLIVWDWED